MAISTVFQIGATMKLFLLLVILVSSCASLEQHEEHKIAFVNDVMNNPDSLLSLMNTYDIEIDNNYHKIKTDTSYLNSVIKNIETVKEYYGEIDLDISCSYSISTDPYNSKDTIKKFFIDVTNNEDYYMILGFRWVIKHNHYFLRHIHINYSREYMDKFYSPQAK
jgi:hypothetical protein